MAIFKAAESKHSPVEETILLHFVTNTDGSIDVKLKHSDGSNVSDGPAVVKFYVEGGKLTLHRYGWVSSTYVNVDGSKKINVKDSH